MKQRTAFVGMVTLALVAFGGCKKDGETPGTPGQPVQPAQPGAPVAGAPAAQPAGQPAAQPAGQPAAQPAGQPAAQPVAAPTGDEPKEKVEVAFHVMSQCPFGTQVEDGIKPVLDKLGKAVDFKLFFIGDEPSPGQLQSMHGDAEVQGDIIHLCAVQHAPDKYMDVIVCMNRDSQAIPGNFDACATEAKIDPAAIKACASGDEGKKLLSASFAASKAKNAQGSPTMFVAGKPYNGGRKELDFMRAICAEYKVAQPEACKALPAPKKVEVTVLTDKRCKDCMTDGILAQLKGTFPGLDAKVLDYSDAAGKALWDNVKDQNVRLPLFLFNDSAKDDPAFADIERFLQPVKEWKSLRVGANFDPSAEICDNAIDDDADGKLDCDDENCALGLVCRKAETNRLDVFVMSQCPFGLKALNAMKEVLDAFGNQIDFRVHFIADETQPGQFNALHGAPEVAENIRQLCVIKHYPKDYAWMQYILCRNQNIQSEDWKACATGDIKADVIEKCVTDEGTKLLSEDIKLAKALDINASPTWLANNKFTFNGVAAEQVKAQFCNYNPGKAGCEKTLSGQAEGPSGGCGQ